MSKRAATLATAAMFVMITLPLGGATAVQRPLVTGITTPDVGSHEHLGYDRIRQTGATFTRVILGWSAVAPAKKPDSWDPTDPSDSNYNWSAYDSQIRMLFSAGLEPLVTVYSAPRWAERCNEAGQGICNPDPSNFADFAEAAARRYNGDFEDLPKVRFWEPWNEPNLFVFFKPQFENGKKVSPGLYRELLNRFASVVKGVDPDNLIVGGGLAPIEVPGAIGPLDFARRLLCMKGRNNPVPIPGCSAKARFDIWANNPYTTGGPNHESRGVDDVSLGDLPEMGRLLKAARKAGKIRSTNKKIPFWVTEFSWDSQPSDPGGVPMNTLTRWTSEAMFRSWQAGVSNFFWLSLRDWPRAEGLPYSETIESGLYFRGDTIEGDRPKKVLKAFRFPFVSFRKAKTISVWGRTPESTAGKVVLSYRNGGGWKRLGATNANRFGVFRTVIKTNLGRGNRGVARAQHGAEKSLPFSLKPTRDRYQPPFGKKR